MHNFLSNFVSFPENALTLLVGWQEGQLTFKDLTPGISKELKDLWGAGLTWSDLRKIRQ